MVMLFAWLSWGSVGGADSRIALARSSAYLCTLHQSLGRLQHSALRGQIRRWAVLLAAYTQRSDLAGRLLGVQHQQGGAGAACGGGRGASRVGGAGGGRRAACRGCSKLVRG
jgi:hypothetical protein